MKKSLWFIIISLSIIIRVNAKNHDDFLKKFPNSPGKIQDISVLDLYKKICPPDDIYEERITAKTYYKFTQQNPVIFTVNGNPVFNKLFSGTIELLLEDRSIMPAPLNNFHINLKGVIPAQVYSFKLDNSPKETDTGMKKTVNYEYIHDFDGYEFDSIQLVGFDGNLEIPVHSLNIKKVELGDVGYFKLSRTLDSKNETSNYGKVFHVAPELIEGDYFSKKNIQFYNNGNQPIIFDCNNYLGVEEVSDIKKFELYLISSNVDNAIMPGKALSFNFASGVNVDSGIFNELTSPVFNIVIIFQDISGKNLFQVFPVLCSMGYFKPLIKNLFEPLVWKSGEYTKDITITRVSGWKGPVLGLEDGESPLVIGAILEVEDIILEDCTQYMGKEEHVIVSVDNKSKEQFIEKVNDLMDDGWDGTNNTDNISIRLMIMNPKAVQRFKVYYYNLYIRYKDPIFDTINKQFICKIKIEG